ncbi:MAG: hypothetical protein WD844_04620 [Thermoleophilaceae bacterium]
MTDERVERAEEAEVHGPPAWAQTPRPGNGRRRRPAERARDADFPLALRGYEKAAVDAYVEEMTELELEPEPQPDDA